MAEEHTHEIEHLLVEIENNIAVITLNRPDKLNALNKQLLDDLYDAFIDLANDAEVKGIILTGAGEKAFAAGADIKELATLNALEAQQLSQKTADFFSFIETLKKPVIAAVNGFALGGGNELAMACHMRWAAEHAKFGQPEVNLGIICGYGGSQRLARLVGKGRAIELLISGTMIDANTAEKYGLVNHVVPQATLLESCKEFLKTVFSKSPLAVGLSMEAIHRGLSLPLEQAIALESDLFGLVCGTADAKEGTSAFLEKRSPNFTGE